MSQYAIIKSSTKRHKPALVIAFIILVIGFSWVIPPQEAYFPLQRRLQEIWIIMLGIAAIPFWLATLNAPLVTIIMIPIAAVVVGLLIQGAFRSKGWLRKIVVLSLLVFNSLTGFPQLWLGFGGGVLENDPTIECQHINASGEGTRITRYVQEYALGGIVQFFFLSTDNNGKTRNQLGSASYEYFEVGCRADRFYGNTDFNYYSCLPETEAQPAMSCNAILFRPR